MKKKHKKTKKKIIKRKKSKKSVRKTRGKLKSSCKIRNHKKRAEFTNFLPLNKSAEAAIYYGFSSIKPLQISKDDVRKAVSLKDSWTRNPTDMPWLFSQDFVKERISLFREYTEKKLSSHPQPVTLIHESDVIKERAKSTINLEVIGTERSIAEALLIRTAVSILEDNGYKNLIIEINSIGDKESMSKFSRELTNYYKKNLNSLPAHCRQNFKKDSFYVLLCDECDAKSKLKENAPASISCLSDESRIHFKEVLEYIETMNISYKINNYLLSDRKYCSGTIFKIKEILSDGNVGETLAIGFRYDRLAQKIGYKKDIPGAGTKIFIKKKPRVIKIAKLKKPIAFYIQLGDEAKHKSFEIIEILKKEKIYIYHMLGRDKFGSQFSLVEKLKIPYVIIMGKKEFLENSVMVRENSTRIQQTIPVDKLAEHIKNLS